MKKILSVTIALCLIFASVLPVYAEAWTSAEAQQVTSAVTQILAQALQISSKLGTIDSSGRTVLDNILIAINQLAGWLVPDGARPSSAATMLDSVVVIANYLMNNLTSIDANTGTISANTGNILTVQNLHNLAHTYFFENGITNPNGGAGKWVNVWGLTINGGADSNSMYFRNTDAIGVLPAFLYMINFNTMQTGRILYNSFNQMHTGWFAKDYDAQLGIWDSQGETLTQEGWTATSVVNGLYKYLAYTQRDVARLTYVLASDEEIETREKARETQTAVMDDFIDPEGGAAASTDNFGEIASGSENVRQNFSTGYSVSNMWSAFGSEHYGWFSQECADALDTSATSTTNNRLLKNDKHDESDYDTPLLDEYYKQILRLGGGNDD